MVLDSTMASNQDHLFIVHPVIPDSSKLRFSQGCGSFNLDLFNAAAKADRKLIDLITFLDLFLNPLEACQNGLSKERSIKTLLERAKENLEIITPHKIRPKRSPNAPNTLLAFSLAAA